MAKGEKCPGCCPQGGAVFRMGFGWRGEAQDNYAMTCQNCGYQRTPRPRKANPLKNYDFVTTEATSDERQGHGRTLRDVLPLLQLEWRICATQSHARAVERMGGRKF